MRISDIIKGLSALGAPQFKRDTLGKNITGVAAPGGANMIERRPVHKKDNFLKQRFAVIDDMAAAVGSTTLAWTRASGTCVLENSTDHTLDRLGCTNAIKLTTLSSFERIQKNFPAGIRIDNGTLTAWIYISEMPTDYSPTLPSPPLYQTAAIQLAFGTDANFNGSTVGIATSMSLTSSQFLRSGWNCIQLRTDDDGTLNTTGGAAWVYTGTGPGAATTSYTYARLILSGLQPYAGITPVVYFGGLFQNGQAFPQVLVNVDDTHADTTDIVNLANSMGIKCSCAAITGSVGVGAQLTWAQLRALDAAGNDVIGHSRTHPAAGFETLTPTQLASEFGCKDDLTANGLGRVADVLAYPTNNANDRVIAAAEAYGFTLARWSRPGWMPIAQGIDRPCAIGSRDLGGKTLVQAKKYLDSAAAYACAQAIYMHKIATKSISSMTYSAGVVSVTATSHGYSVGNIVHHRGADQAYYNVAGVVETVADSSHYTFKVTGSFPVTTATSATANLRSFSPNFPASGGTAPADTLTWYWSDYIAFFKEISDRVTAGTLSTATYSSLLDRCQVG